MNTYNTGIIKDADDPLSDKFSVQTWSRCLLVYVCVIFSIADPRGPHK